MHQILSFSLNMCICQNIYISYYIATPSDYFWTSAKRSYDYFFCICINNTHPLTVLQLNNSFVYKYELSLGRCFQEEASLGIPNFCINHVVKYEAQDGGWRCQTSNYLPHLLLYMAFTYVPDEYS